MASRPLFFFIFLVFLLPFAVSSTALCADEGKILYEKGDALLKAGDLDAALKAYKEASGKDRENKKYAAKVAVLSNIIEARNFVRSNDVSPKWEKAAAVLHAFYLNNGLLKEALALDREIHKKLNSETSAALLGETLLEMDKNEEALTLLKGREAPILQNRLYWGIALARLGRMGEARRLEKEILLPDDTDAGNLFEAARFKTLMGEQKNALFLLTLCLERTLESRQAQVKNFIRRSRDLKPLMNTEEFKKVMATKSKVKE